MIKHDDRPTAEVTDPNQTPGGLADRDCDTVSAGETPPGFGIWRPWVAVLVLGITCSGTPAAPHGVRFVRPDATGDGDGSTWQDAFTDLQSALAGARDAGGHVTEIWVAAGRYVPAAPEPSGDPRRATFEIVPCVSVYGGFRGYEAERSERDPVANVTVLSGDVMGNDSLDPASRQDNCWHVVTVPPGVGVTTVIDGFIIADGNASGEDDETGAGALVLGSVTFQDCLFEHNQARAHSGGGVALYGDATVLRECWFLANRALAGGAIAIRGGGANAEIQDCIFEYNTADSGAAIFTLNDGDIHISGSQFASNQAERFGGAVYFDSSNLTVTDSDFWSNSASDGSAINVRAGGPINDVTIKHSGFYANHATGKGTVAFRGAEHFTIDGVIFDGNTAESGGAMYVNSISPIVIRQSYFTNNEASQGGAIFLLAAHLYMSDCLIQGNTATEGGGMYAEDLFKPFVVTRTEIVDNVAGTQGGGVSAYVFAPSYSFNMTFSNCVVARNYAGDSGGGFSLLSPPGATILNSLVAGNFAETGAGIEQAGTDLTIAGTTIVSNAAASAPSGVLCSPTTTVSNTILWNNYVGPYYGKQTREEQDQILGVDAGRINHSIVQGWTDTLGGEGNAGLDPQFVSLLGPDGQQRTGDENLRLLFYSPAIDAGDPTIEWAPGDADLDGHRRVLCGRIDVGAYEFGIGDFDCNGTVGIQDFTKWSACALGPDVTVEGEACGAYDVNADGNIDLRDFAGFAGVFGK